MTRIKGGRPNIKQLLVLLLGFVFSIVVYLFPPFLWKVESGPTAPSLGLGYAFRCSLPKYYDKSVQTNEGTIVDTLTLAEVMLIIAMVSILYGVLSESRKR